MHQRYVSDTAKKTEDHTSFFAENKTASQKIDRLVRQIAARKAKIDLMKLKKVQHAKEWNARN